MSVGTGFLPAVGLAVGFLLGIVGRAYVQARLADRLGDKTPRFQGRLTLNPRAHVDPLGTLVLPGIFTLGVLVGSPFGIMFGWGKAVPVQPHRLRDPRNGPLIVALAGPATCFVIAAAAGLLLVMLAPPPGQAAPVAVRLLVPVVVSNSFLTVLNALPIPPLDGSKVLARFLSPHGAMRMEEIGQYGLLFLLLFLIFPPLGGILVGLVRPVVTLVTSWPVS